MSRVAFTTATMEGTFAAKAQAMQRAGFTATELWGKDLFDHYEGPEVALRMLADHGLRVATFQAIRHLEGCPRNLWPMKFDIARRMLDLAVLAGSPLVTLAANSQPGCSGDVELLCEDLARLAVEAQSRGLRVAFEAIAWAPHVNHWRRAQDIVRAVASPALGLQLDLFHVFAGGEAGVPIQEIDVGRIFLVEVCDFVPTRMPLLEASRNWRLFPGEGAADLHRFARDLHASSYTGDVALEMFNAACRQQAPQEVAARGWAAMRDVFAPWFGKV